MALVQELILSGLNSHNGLLIKHSTPRLVFPSAVPLERSTPLSDKRKYNLTDSHRVLQTQFLTTSLLE